MTKLQDMSSTALSEECRLPIRDAPIAAMAVAGGVYR